MPFNSLQFLVFFPAAALLFFLFSKQRYQLVMIIFLSSIFYMSFLPAYILLIFLIITADFFLALLLEKTLKTKFAKPLFITGILFNIFILAFFKYISFLTINLNELLKFVHISFSVHVYSFLLPIGISFFIFKSISYLTEVYRGNINAERSYLSVSGYILFFPELLAGPIDRPQMLIPQLNRTNKLTYENLKKGIELFAWGLFLKIVISDRLALLVDKIYSSPFEYSGLHLIIATVFFAFQIYTDFAGYSYIAIGCGRILGFNLMQNFNYPYFSESISEFWSRWHISLSTWLRDYLFLPISYPSARKLQKLKLKRNLNIRIDIISYCTGIFITMFIGGLWHGAGWNFIIWGLIIAFYLIFSVITSKYRKRFRRKTGIGKMAFLPYVRMLFTFGLMCIAWIFFRAANIGEGYYILTHVFSGLDSVSLSSSYFLHEWSKSRIGMNSNDFILSIFLVVFLIVFEFLQFKNKLKAIISYRPEPVKAVLFVIFFIIILLLGNFSSEQFIYFRF